MFWFRPLIFKGDIEPCSCQVISKNTNLCFIAMFNSYSWGPAKDCSCDLFHIPVPVTTWFVCNQLDGDEWQTLGRLIHLRAAAYHWATLEIDPQFTFAECLLRAASEKQCCLQPSHPLHHNEVFSEEPWSTHHGSWKSTWASWIGFTSRLGESYRSWELLFATSWCSKVYLCRTPR
jgi:hypothetical protein